jgi:hypothetical protein
MGSLSIKPHIKTICPAQQALQLPSLKFIELFCKVMGGHQNTMDNSNRPNIGNRNTNGTSSLGKWIKQEETF